MPKAVLQPTRMRVFAKPADLLCLDIDDPNFDAMAKAALADGYAYAGSLEYDEDGPVVHIEPGHWANIWCAGVYFVGVAAERVQRYQLALASEA